jgi:predicted nucleic acid-binding protein
VAREPETPALVDYLGGAGAIASSELVLAEAPRAIRRLAAEEAPRHATRVLTELGRVLEQLVLLRLDRRVLGLAGQFEEPFLRALDAIHLATALGVKESLTAFVTYDGRQRGAAEYAGIATVAPERGSP